MLKTLSRPLVLTTATLACCALSLTTNGCSGGSSGGGAPPPPPAAPDPGGSVVNNAQSLSDAVTIDGGVKFEGDILSPGGETGGDVEISTQELVVTQGSSFLFELAPNVAADRRVDAFVVQIAGSNDHFIIPVSNGDIVLPAVTAANTNRVAPSVRCARRGQPCAGMVLRPSGTISSSSNDFSAPARAQAYTSPITAPVPDLSGIFDRMRTAPDPTDWTTPINFQVRYTKVVESDPQISLTWDAAVDVDLYVTEPGGEVISYQTRTSTTGGELDTDNTSGFGPENVSWADDNAPVGSYQVEVDYFRGTDPVNFTVVVTNNGQRQEYRGTLNAQGDRATVANFSVSAQTPSDTTTLVGNPVPITVGGGGSLTGITVWTDTRQGHLSGQYGISVRLDGRAVTNQNTILSKATTAPTTCDPTQVSFDRVSFEVTPGTHTISATLPGNPTFNWPEVTWEKTIFVPQGTCVILRLTD